MYVSDIWYNNLGFSLPNDKGDASGLKLLGWQVHKRREGSQFPDYLVFEEIKRRIILMFHPFTFDDSAMEIFVRGNNDTYVIIITWIFRADFAKPRLH